jgi:hypothetical protein
MRLFDLVRFYVFMLLSLGIFAVSVATPDPFGRWLGMIAFVFGVGLNLFVHLKKALSEPYPPNQLFPNQRAAIRALIGVMAAIFIPWAVVILIVVLLVVILRG